MQDKKSNLIEEKIMYSFLSINRPTLKYKQLCSRALTSMDGNIGLSGHSKL